ncbi:MAG: helix-turn-helix transcriptional regulator [Geobacteraceae bacterium]|jgi:DNA-binding PadR family transcriptional regulator
MPAKRKQQYRHLPAFILLALAEGPIHGGAIHSALIARMPKYKSDTGAVYRTLQQLERDGEVQSTWDTSNSGPARKIYQLTPLGWEKLDDWKKDIEMRIENLNYFLRAYRQIMKHSDKKSK